MKLEKYLSEGKRLKDFGYLSDGCTLVGTIVHKLWPQLEQACWSHDYARRGLINTNGQYDNDKLFRDALKHLGAPTLLRFTMYTGVRLQHITDMSPATLIGFIFFLTVLGGMFWHSSANANDLVLDPTIEGQTTLTVVCTYPIERENNEPIAIDEIAKVTFHVKKQGDSDSLYAPAGENTTECKQVYDMTQVPDGAYVYAAKVIDTDGRSSVYSTEVVNALVKRLLPPAKTGLTGLLS